MTLNPIDFTHFFHADRLSIIMISLVTFVAIAVGSFAIRYLNGDRKQKAFFYNLIALLVSVFVMVCANHIIMLLVSWAVSNALLARLMLHKQEWEAARQSYILASKNFALGLIFLSVALLIAYVTTGETSIQGIIATTSTSGWLKLSSIFLVLAAMTQSALWPFNTWLTSSLNSPTPVSAIMHAGLINGGGFLLARFAPMLSGQPQVLNLVFIVGITTALIGTLWKLMQSDVKRMLACSTMGQMGFMIAQCGLGLFPAAVAHLCWHGLFKAYLFLASGSAAKEKRFDLGYPPTYKEFLPALICGGMAAFAFSLTSDKQLGAADTTLFLTFLALITGAQFALSILCGKGKAKFILAPAATVIMGAFYGLSVLLIENALSPALVPKPQPLDFLHFLAAGLLLVSWLSIMFLRSKNQKLYPAWLLKKYVQMLNASQPHPKTITASRNEYQF